MLSAPTALAAGVKAPPGNSGVGEYVEAVPDGTGRHVANNLHNAAIAEAGGDLDGDAQAALEGAGEDGKGAAALAAAGTIAPEKGAGAGDSGSSPFSSTIKTLGAGVGAGGLGAIFPLLLLLLLAGAAGYQLKRRQAGS